MEHFLNQLIFKTLHTQFHLSEDVPLQEYLTKAGKNRWLDIGCGGNFEPGFHYLDVFPEGLLSPKIQKQYYRIDILTVSPDHLASLGKFDLVRLQHTFEHFSWEEAEDVLRKCAMLLNENGLLLISVPDLRVHITKYLSHEYKADKGFAWWATQRIPESAPDSCYFSIYAHSLPFEPHKWCYDSEGLVYRIETTDLFIDIKELLLASPLASVPFTHNRPAEDLCVIARLKLKINDPPGRGRRSAATITSSN